MSLQIGRFRPHFEVADQEHLAHIFKQLLLANFLDYLLLIMGKKGVVNLFHNAHSIAKFGIKMQKILCFYLIPFMNHYFVHEFWESLCLNKSPRILLKKRVP